LTTFVVVYIPKKIKCLIKVQINYMREMQHSKSHIKFSWMGLLSCLCTVGLFPLGWAVARGGPRSDEPPADAPAAAAAAAGGDGVVMVVVASG
jgi:hypothetical protein